MKIKKEYTILALLIIALSLYLLLRQSDRTQYDLPPLPPIPANTITRIDINGPERVLSLRKKDDQWLLEPQSYTADSVS